MLLFVPTKKTAFHPVRALVVLVVAVGSLFLLLSAPQSRSQEDMPGKSVHVERSSQATSHTQEQHEKCVKIITKRLHEKKFPFAHATVHFPDGSSAVNGAADAARETLKNWQTYRHLVVDGTSVVVFGDNSVVFADPVTCEIRDIYLGRNDEFHVGVSSPTRKIIRERGKQDNGQRMLRRPRQRKPKRVLKFHAEKPREKSITLSLRGTVSQQKEGTRRVRKFLTRARNAHTKDRIQVYYYAMSEETGGSTRRLEEAEDTNVTAAEVADLSQNVSAQELGQVLNATLEYVDYHYFDLEYSELEDACVSFLAGETSVTIDMTTTSGQEVAATVTIVSLTGCDGDITDGSILYHTTEYVIACPDTATCQVSQRITADELQTGALSLEETGQYPLNESQVDAVFDKLNGNETAIGVSRRRRLGWLSIVGAVGGVVLIVVGTALAATGVGAGVGVALIAVGVVLIAAVATGAGCYPKLSVVWTRHGPRSISSVSVGDTVRVFDPRSGSLAWSDVYMQGHAVDGVLGRFFSLTTATNLTVSATGHHFMPVVPVDATGCQGFLRDGDGQDFAYVRSDLPGGQFWKKCVKMTRAKNIRINDWLLTADADESVLVARVKGKRQEIKVGMYNPHTKSGTIVVNGVIGSVHAETVFDVYLSSSWDPYLPAFFQWVFSPLEFMYDHFQVCAMELDGVHKHGLGEVSLKDIFGVAAACLVGKVFPW